MELNRADQGGYEVFLLSPLFTADNWDVCVCDCMGEEGGNK